MYNVQCSMSECSISIEHTSIVLCQLLFLNFNCFISTVQFQMFNKYSMFKCKETKILHTILWRKRCYQQFYILRDIQFVFFLTFNCQIFDCKLLVISIIHYCNHFQSQLLLFYSHYAYNIFSHNTYSRLMEK